MPKNTPEQIIDSPFVRAQRTLSTSTIAPDGGGGGGGGEMEIHTLSGSYHSGQLADGQFNRALLIDGIRPLQGNLSVLDGVTIDGVDISLHAANPNAHHAAATAGDGIILSGQQIAVDLEGTTSGLEFNSGDLRVNNYNGISRDANGIGLHLRSGMTALSVDASGLYMADVLAGDGLTIAPTTRILAVGAGAGIVVNTNDVALNPLVAGAGMTFSSGAINVIAGNGTLTVAPDSVVVNEGYAFTWSAQHTFNADIQLAANLDFTGGIRNITTAGSDNLNIIPGGDLVLNPGGSNVLPGGSIEDDLGDYNRKWRTLFAAELYVETLVAQDVLATIGGRILVAPTTTLIADVTAGAGVINVKHNNLPNNAYVMLQTAPGGFAQFEVMKISGVAPVEVTGGWRYGISDRAVDGTAANAWLAGDAVVSLGNSVGDGYIELTSTETVHQHLGPTIAIYSRTGTAAWNDTAPVVAMGNLSSFVGYDVDTFGVALGNDLTLDPETGFKGLTADASAGLRLFNTDIYLYEDGALGASFTTEEGILLLQDVGHLSHQQRVISWMREIPAGPAVSTITSYSDAPGWNYMRMSASRDAGGHVEMHLNGGTTEIVLGDEDAGGYLWLRSNESISLRAPGTAIGPFADTMAPASILHIAENTTAVGVGAGVTIEQRGTGDAVLQFNLFGGQRFVLGIDQTDYKFKITDSPDLATATILAIDPATDRVGIGIASPAGKLHVADTSGGATAGIIFGGSVTSGYALSFLLDDTGLKFGHNSAVRDLQFQTASLTRFRIKGNGFVSVGDIEPVARFHVFGNTTSTGATAGQTIEQAGTGDSVLHWVAGGKVYSAGIDNDDGDKWKLTTEYDLSTGDPIIVFDPATGVTTIAGITVGGAGGGDHDPVTAAAGGGITVVGQQISVDSTVVRTSTLAARRVIAGAGLSDAGNDNLSANITLSVNLGAGLSFVGDAITADAAVLPSSAAGAGLAYAAGVLSVNAASGLAISGDNVILASSAAGAGLDYTSGILSVNAASGLAISGDNVILASGAAGDGLTYTSGVLDVVALSTGGLEVGANEIHIKFLTPYSGLIADVNGLRVRDDIAGDGLDILNKILFVGQGNGITVDTNTVAVLASTAGGLTVGGTGVGIKLRTISPGSGLFVDADGLRIQRRGSSGNDSGITMTTTDGIFLSDSVAGAGLVWSAADTRFLAVGAGAGIAVAADAVAVNQGYNFNWTGDHMFNTGVVTFNTDVQVDANLDFLGARFITSNGTNNLTLQPGGDLVLDPGADDVLPRGSIEIDLGDYNRKYRTLYAAELYVETLVAQEVMATIGGRVMVAPTTTLIADVTSGALTISVKHNNLPNNSYVLLQTANLTGVGSTQLAQFEVMKITSSVVVVTGGYRYNVARNVDGSDPWPDGGVHGNTWLAGDAVVNLGNAIGDGYIELTSTKTIHTHLGPTIAIYARTGTAAWDDTKPVTAMGNLSSFVDYSGDEFGFAVGNDLTKAPTDPTTPFKGLTADREDGVRLFNTDLLIYDTGVLSLTLTSASGLRLTVDDNDAATGMRHIAWYEDVATLTGRRGLLQTYEIGDTASMMMRAENSGAGTRADMILAASANSKSGGIYISSTNTGAETVDGLVTIDAEQTAVFGKMRVGDTTNSNPAISPLHVYESTTMVGTEAGLTIEQDGTGDAVLQFLLTGVRRWTTGIDQSASGQPYVISAHANLSTTPEFVLTNTGALTLSGSLAIGGALTGVTTIAMTGALTGATALTAATLTANTTLISNTLAARTAAGLSITDDGGNVGITIADGGAVTIPTLATTSFTVATLTATTAMTSNTLSARTSAGLRLEDDGGNLGVFVADGGNVGIGNAAPGAAKLTVTDSSGGAAGNITFGSSVTSGYTLSFATDDTGLKVGHNSSSRDLEFQTNSLTRLTVLGTGEVGIGILVPTTKFHVHQASTTAESVRIDNPNATTVFASQFGQLNLVNSNATNGNFARVNFQGTTAAPASAAFAARFTDHANNYADFTIWTRSAAGITEKMTILSAGNVGIGDSAPTAKLSVEDTVGGLEHLWLTSRGNAPTLHMRRAQASGAVLAAQDIANIAGSGRYDSTTFAVGAFMRFTTTQNWSSGARGTKIVFGTTNTGTTATNPTFEIQHNGTLVSTGTYGNAPNTARFPRPVSIDSDGLMSSRNFWTPFMSHSQARMMSVDPDGILGAEDLYNKTLAVTPIRPVVVDASNYAGTPNLYDRELGDVTARPLFITSGGNIGWQNATRSGGGRQVVVTAEGWFYSTTSSLRYKQDIQPVAPDSYEQLFDSLRPVRYRYDQAKAFVDDETRVYAGLLAEDVHEAGGGEFVHYDKEGRPDALMYDQMIVVLIMELQQLKREVSDMKGKMM